MIKNEDLYNELIAAKPFIQRKGKTVPYTSVNGYMFSFLSKEGTLGLRLSEGDFEELRSKYKAKQLIQYEKNMRGYLEIPFEQFKDLSILSEYMQKSFEYVSGLKPKPTRNK